QNVSLDAVVDHDGAPGRVRNLAVSLLPCPWSLAPFVGLAGADVLGKIDAFESRKAARPFGDLGEIESAGRLRRGYAGRHAAGPDARRKGARVDACNSRDVVHLEPGVEPGERAVVGGMLGVGAHDQTPHRGRERLDVLAVRSDDADMGKGEGDDLSGI